MTSFGAVGSVGKNGDEVDAEREEEVEKEEDEEEGAEENGVARALRAEGARVSGREGRARVGRCRISIERGRGAMMVVVVPQIQWFSDAEADRVMDARRASEQMSKDEQMGK